MHLKYKFLIVALFALAIGPILYKVFVLELDLLPKNKKDIWELEFSARVQGSDQVREVQFPVPQPSDRLLIHSTKFEGKQLQLTLKKTTEGVFAVLKGKTPDAVTTYYRVHLRSKSEEYPLPQNDTGNHYPERVKAFLKPIELYPETEALVTRLEEELFIPSHNKAKIIKSLYYFINEEILRTPKSLGLKRVLLHYKGSARDKANLFTVIARRQGIPARTVRGIKLTEQEDLKQKITYWNEVYLGEQWIPIFATHGYLGSIPKAFIPLYTSIDLTKKLQEEGYRLTINARRMLSDHFNALAYKDELAHKDSIFVRFSPYMLPLGQQQMMKLLLLFAVGTVVLAVGRNILGLKTFGIFFPILLALFFKQTSLVFGVGFFLFVIGLGYAERFILSRMYLLAVPRFSIILTFLVMTLLLYTLLNNYYQFSPHNPAILPIIITTMFIERFSITLEEEGMRNTVIILLGTVTITILSYALFSWKLLETFIYTHPELLFAIVAILMLIGKYSGYRVSELIRFRELTRKIS